MIIAYDADWQHPAITEQHAYVQAKKYLPRTSRVAYVGFPWATLFDATARKATHLAHLEEELATITAQIPADVRVVTVCQHIDLEKHLHFLKRCGITDVFWSHARTRGEFLFNSRIRAWPFPLYPVQQFVPKPFAERDVLFSFVGATSNQWYLTQSRSWIGEFLSETPEAVVALRENWHFNKVVYDHQMRGDTSLGSAALTDERAAAEFKDIMARSVFALCPSGTGPNSIRLWECIQAGIVPVVLADSYMPPGNPALWELATVHCPETKADIKKLPERLRALAADPEAMAAKHHALAQLRLCYGVSSFVYDLVEFVSNPSTWLAPEERVKTAATFYTGDEATLPHFTAQEHVEQQLYFRSLATALLLERDRVISHLSHQDEELVVERIAEFVSEQTGDERVIYERIFQSLPFWQQPESLRASRQVEGNATSNDADTLVEG